MEIITAAEYRNGILNLMVECLGCRWAREHVLVPYGGLNEIPEADLPGLYTLAQLDAYEAMAASTR